MRCAQALADALDGTLPPLPPLPPSSMQSGRGGGPDHGAVDHKAVLSMAAAPVTRHIVTSCSFGALFGGGTAAINPVASAAAGSALVSAPSMPSWRAAAGRDNGVGTNRSSGGRSVTNDDNVDGCGAVHMGGVSANSAPPLAHLGDSATTSPVLNSRVNELLTAMPRYLAGAMPPTREAGELATLAAKTAEAEAADAYLRHATRLLQGGAASGVGAGAAPGTGAGAAPGAAPGATPGAAPAAVASSCVSLGADGYAAAAPSGSVAGVLQQQQTHRAREVMRRACMSRLAMQLLPGRWPHAD